MGQNKRWKRKAKRIKGHCIAEAEMCDIGGVDECPYYNDCEIVSPKVEPCNLNIRKLEKNYKYFESFVKYSGDLIEC